MGRGVIAEARSGCAINAAVEALGDHWSFLVLRDMIFGDRRYFRELLNGSIEGIASNILSDRLKKLVAAGLLTKEEAVRGRRVRYSLTEAGIQTLPILFALGNWGLDWREGTPELRTRQELMRAEGPAFIEELMDELRVHHLGAPPVERDGPGPLERLEAAYQRAAAKT
ncbi:helix-turn-helix domain-containing protein [Glycomyces sp. NRRL B-16210]|uniref:winged helix-turn-helix transcriptional regulator n=1 Tax=Glycomyces sp. NRRL B-16210 TaxID=1463821 RepID=UPI000A58638F|nr:helix-turn-helix domain-containing protein [Glycomyces sp. NRRL B-16210]